MFNSNMKRALWPIIASVNDLPPNLRFLRKNALVVGLWLHKGEPDLDVFMKPFLITLQQLYSDELQVGSIQVPTIRTVACCVDTMARCKLQKFKQFNGYDGCSFCLHPGHTTRHQVKYGYLEEVQTRNYKDTLRAMSVSISRTMPINGVKGVSSVILIPSFDIVNQCPVDFIHSVLLGVVKQLCRIWFEKPSTSYYIKNKLHCIDSSLCGIHPFTEASRTTRKISERNTWKANEWLQWLLHFSSICLKPYLPNEQYKHHRVLVTSIAQLLQPNLSENTLNACDIQLKKYVKDFEIFYSIDEMNYNVHLLLHIVQCCKNFGPLWAFSLFFYEDINGVLKKYAKGPKEPLIQIANRYTMSHARYYSVVYTKTSIYELFF
ncbi:uncharacterized protein LOC131695030 [Topomyia yanbarensis]|uniref:uncharacterized protein LOC131694850 n=1 Tax=Topomyia yanbarensis TaxID=2498891 RepID=UPI00273C786C|nr:uncharacterized protein LOC131694850 [Topomyia yanbarensis]XP_058839339.1 uncharacterized protein LOC131694850 [Topomyia yanbarensis]XP_058839340.1 uncharacterized protein LOC131694850 [Topomyia yanbarensis]XP_058839546.1 uncharacterized protein LOC131695030 [Topomyia yanbarensis]